MFSQMQDFILSIWLSHIFVFFWKILRSGTAGCAATAKSLQSCPTLCDPIDGSPPGSPIPGILQARTLEWVAISFSSAWKWKVKVKSFSCARLCDPMDCSLPRLPCPWEFPGKSTGVGCHCLLRSEDCMDCMVVLFIIFWRNSILFSILAASIYIPTSSEQGFPLLHILANACDLWSIWW